MLLGGAFNLGRVVTRMLDARPPHGKTRKCSHRLAQNPLPGVDEGYFRQASIQIGVKETNDFETNERKQTTSKYGWRSWSIIPFYWDTIIS